MSKYAGASPFETRDGLPVLPGVPARQYHHEHLRTRIVRAAILVFGIGLLTAAAAIPLWIFWMAEEINRNMD